ncbi:MAG: protein kinase [Deltaproteobacteria bacterium]|nr:protein kinase [Deltaproteobacteria bacterium]
MNNAKLFKLEPGTILDKKYRIDDVIGSGGMGYVYSATNVVLKREVAVKTLQVYRNGDDTAVQRFHQEAQIAASIGHDNICEVIDFGTHHPTDGEFDVYYLIMPLLTGQSLGQWFDSWVRPSPALFVDIISQTLLGLHAAHQKKIVHRDLKPDNIFITHIGDRDNFVKILDFGISKYLESEAALSLTQTGIAMGTPLYMCPEQAKGLKYIDHTADIYSVGVVLYEGFVGQLPYTGDNFNDVLLKIATKPFVEPRRLNPNVPREIEGVILKAMSRLPKDRYLTALQMRRALLRGAAMANIDERKSFVYPTSTNPPPASHTQVQIHSAMVQDETTNRRLIETRLKAMQQGGNTTSATGSSALSPGSLKLLVGIIVASLLIASLGVAYILKNRRSETTESANIVPVVPAATASSPLKPMPGATAPAGRDTIEAATLPSVAMPADVSFNPPKGTTGHSEQTGPSRSKSGQGKKRPIDKELEKQQQAVQDSTSASPSPTPLFRPDKKGSRDRFIERDADQIFN